MQCRPSSPTDDLSCSSLLSTSFDCTNTLKHDISPPSVTSRRRRRLEDPVITHASNYYVINPRPATHSAPPSTPQIQQKSDDKNIYCDLYNLLERPAPIKQKKKQILKDSKSSRNHRSIIYKNSHAKLKDINERKRYQQQSSSSKESFSSDHLQDKGKSQRWISQRHLASKEFFRRVVGNYFCLPMAVAYEELSN